MNPYIILQKIVEIGSFTKAANILGYTQSSLSQTISSLENELSIKLLSRSRAGVELTKEGKELYPYIERSIVQFQIMKEKVNEIKGLGTGTIRIGAIASVTAYWLPELIREFQIDFPKVQFILYQGDYSSIQQWIKEGTVDFGFITPNAVTKLETVSIKSGEMLAVLPKKHQLATLPQVDLFQISKEPFILLEEGHYNEPLNAFQKYELTPNIKYTLHDDYAIMKMVEAGLGISILAKLMVENAKADIVSIPITEPIMRKIAIGYKDKDALPIASKKFIDFIVLKKDELI
ncbi:MULTISPECIES: LysR family transcriptional regulator [unclassified Enterococcus]|uniref:LysR family transcriptional regulator n=1 Tax=unclassified Enterococcus TaxID=2608891 RepID=UPI0015527F5D|nr:MULTISPECIES: LysR family transcriptional regulator [unclassified Enterococcus]MBS7576905.1 LysR family transcriptional regulator [Enterococcus sp. MMGLQ5-2]MBS7584312.1 LysR family transcriptional regulator [Enterococcus sp. MMGLQ5-1]NPD12168.1 LysR family transcriptional regulator [Enterococcus sp. MMGLQ5-1]NPD36740.1 LysR family transcriptional regulator [Enterococcus sp. MMGLQ5-2]